MKLKELFKGVDGSQFNALSKAGAVGLHLITGVAVGAGMGYFLDKWFETDSIFILIFIFIGICAGIRNTYIDTKSIIKNFNEDKISNDHKHP